MSEGSVITINQVEDGDRKYVGFKQDRQITRKLDQFKHFLHLNMSQVLMLLNCGAGEDS